MNDKINDGRYFRCETYSATISVAACRHYRDLAEQSTVQIGFYVRTRGSHLHPRCKNCRRAELLEDGLVESWPLEQMLSDMGSGGGIIGRVGGED